MCLLFSTLVFEQRCASDLKTTGVYSICCHEAWITVGVPDNHKVTGEFSLIARKTLSLRDPDGCSKVGSRLLLLKYCVLWTWRSKRRKCSGVKLLGGAEELYSWALSHPSRPANHDQISLWTYFDQDLPFTPAGLLFRVRKVQHPWATRAVAPWCSDLVDFQSLTSGIILERGNESSVPWLS